MKNIFFDALEIKPTDNLALHRFARAVGIPVDRLRYYNKCNKIPTGNDLKLISDATGISEAELMIQMGVLDNRMTSLIQKNAKQIYSLIKPQIENPDEMPSMPSLVYETKLGKLYQGDCLSLMKNMDSDSIDLIFADPPFNL